MSLLDSWDVETHLRALRPRRLLAEWAQRMRTIARELSR